MRIENIGFIGLGAMGSVMAPLLGKSDYNVFGYDIGSKIEKSTGVSQVQSLNDLKNMDVIILTDPSNMNYLTGYDGWSFYVPQGIIMALELNEPIWFGRRQDSKGAKVTTYLQDKNIIYYPEDLIQSPPTHPYDFVSTFIHENN